MNVRQAAETLGVSSKTIYAWVAQNRIPFCRAGRRVIFNESDILDWVKYSGNYQPINDGKLTRGKLVRPNFTVVS